MLSVVSFIAGVKARFESEKGATAVEYGLLVALIAAVIIGTVVTLGLQIDGAFQTIVDEMPAAPVAP
jgi:pilus assembly protein Flp/PilA